MTMKEGKEEKVLRTETKISWTIITVLLCIISAAISRETVGSEIQAARDSIAVLEKGRALNEEKIKELQDMKSDVKEIKELLLKHIGNN